MYARWQDHNTAAVTPGFGFVTRFFKGDDSSEGMLRGRLSSRERSSGSMNEHFFCFTLGIMQKTSRLGAKVRVI